MEPAPTVELRPALMADFPLIEAWLRQGEVQRWWGSLAAAQAAVISALSDPMGLCSVVLVGGAPAGYVQAQDAGQADGSSGLAGAYRLDAFIGEARFRGRGIGRQALELAADEVFKSTLTVAVIATVPLRNEAAVRLYERAGFRWVRVIEDALLGPCWLMRRERSS